jgi:DNA mismatch repair protein MutS
MEQYLRIKRNYQDAILFFRMGDFYETFFEDAKITSKELDIVLTSRDKGEGERVPLAGVPWHAAESYIGKLIKKGYKVAICEQVEDPALAKGLVKREVVRVVTPGTVLETPLLSAKDNNFLMALTTITGPKGSDDGGETFGLALVDVSTGEFITTSITGEDRENKLISEIARLRPVECIMPSKLFENKRFVERLMQESGVEFMVSPYPDEKFIPEIAAQTLIDHFKVVTLEGMGCEHLPAAVGASGAILSYVQETQKASLAYINRLTTYSTSNYMILDHTTLRNLEIIRNIRDGSITGTLLDIIDRTVTPMGSRLLRKWLLQPLLDATEIRKRQDAVEELYNNIFLRHDLRETLKSIYDIERLISRIAYGNANARDLIALKQSLLQVSKLRHILETTREQKSEKTVPYLTEIIKGLNGLPDIVELIDTTIVDDPPVSVRDGDLIKPDANEELNKLVAGVLEGKRWIEALEQRERRRTGIKTLKVGYTSVFGYYIEVTKPNLKLVPSDYIRKQTLVNAERFTTVELKEREAFIIAAEEKRKALEYKLFTEVRDKIANKSERIQATARTIASLDVLATLAEVAVKNNYNKPEITESDKIIINNGRHPVVEQLISERFVPNDAYLDCNENQILIITGPNMAGKSTFMRQVALITILAQLGSFVPAESASIGIVDRVFTRVGAFDDLTRGQSTFMVEMVELANILNSATRKSLILLDEVGRGTSTFDGMSIAWAIAEYIHDRKKIGAKTLFATHYHHLTELEHALAGVKNYNIAVKEDKDNIIFLRKIMPGPTDKSYGIQVARLAGLPPDLIKRAKMVLAKIEAEKALTRTPPEKQTKPVRTDARQRYTQMVLFDETEQKRTNLILEELKRLDIMRMTPMEALEKLYELQKKLQAQVAT